MKRMLIALASTLLAAGAAQAAGTVQVNFVDADRFTDIRDGTYRADTNLKALERVLVAVAEPYVADGQTLKIDVLDVDLAGEVRPGARAWDVRVMRGGTDWPRITLRWSLASPGQAARGGEARVSDIAYLQRIQSPLADTHLIYERRMLQEWFAQQLVH